MGMTQAALQRIRDAVGDDDLVVADILQSFVEEVDDLLEQLSRAAAAVDLTSLRRVAHTLKSSCNDLGDAAAGALCAELEKRAQAGSVSNVETAVAEIAAACIALRSEVTEFLGAKA